MMTSLNTMIMMANMNTAAMVEAIFSIVPTARNIPSNKIQLPKVLISQAAVFHISRLFGGDGRNSRVELLQRIAAPLAAPVQALRPRLGDALHQVLEFRVGFGLQGFEANAGRFQRLLGLIVRLLHLLAHGGDHLFSDVDHRLLDLRRELFPYVFADRIRHDETAEAEPVG